MKHGIQLRKLGRDSAHRHALLRNLVTSLIKYDRITTTVPKAKEVRRWADRMVTLGKQGDLHSRRQAESLIQEKSLLSKLFGEMADRYRSRPGGYTRILKTGERFGDKASTAIIEFVDSPKEIGLFTTKKMAEKRQGV